MWLILNHWQTLKIQFLNNLFLYRLCLKPRFNAHQLLHEIRPVHQVLVGYLQCQFVILLLIDLPCISVLFRWCADGELENPGELSPVISFWIAKYFLPNLLLKVIPMCCRLADLQSLAQRVVVPKLMLVVSNYESS